MDAGALGVRLSRPYPTGAGGMLTPWAALYADYRFASNDAPLTTNGPTPQGVSERVAVGLRFAGQNGAGVDLQGEVGGLGPSMTPCGPLGCRGFVPF